MPNAPTRHSKWGGSKAGLMLACPGSVYMRALAPKQKSNEAMERGTLMHEAAAAVLAYQQSVAPTFAKLTEDEARRVMGYAACVQEVIHSIECVHPHGYNWSVEKELVHPDMPEVFTTTDFRYERWTEMDYEIGIVDLKTGEYLVHVKENVQLLYSAWLWLLAMIADGEVPETLPTKIRLGIHQDCVQASIQWWDTTVDEVMAWGAKFQAAIDSADLNAGDHCLDCSGAAVCAKGRAPLQLIKQAYNELTGMPPERVAQLVPMIPAAENVLELLKDYAFSLATKGQLPGYHIVDGKRKPLAWKVDDIDPSKLGLTEEAIYDSKLKTPTQIAKLCSEEKLVALGYADRPAPNPKLEPIAKPSAAQLALTDW